VRVGRRLPAESEIDLPLRRVLIVVASVFMRLVIGAAVIWRQHASRVLNYAFITAVRGDCSVQQIREPRDLIRAPRDRMACTSIPGYLKDSVKLPVGASVGVGVMDEKDPDMIRLIADLNKAGYKVSTVGPIRRVALPH
jgi:hypothetical protein